MTIFVKISGQDIDTFQIVFFRGVFTLVTTFIIIKKKKIYLWGKSTQKLVLRGISGTFALFFVYESIQRFLLSEATVIQYLYPLFTVFFETPTKAGLNSLSFIIKPFWISCIIVPVSF